MNASMKRRLLIISLFIAVAFTWGTTWMAMKIAVATIPPVLATGLRFLCASPLLIALAYYKKVPLLLPPGQRGFQLCVMLFYFAVPFALMFYGESYTTASLAAIIFATMPAAILAVSLVVLREKTSLQQLFGLAISTGALCTILWNENRTSGENQLQGVIALIAAVAIHAMMYVQCKKRGAGIPVLSYNALPCLGAGVLLTLAGLHEKPDFQAFAPEGMMAIAWLGVVAGVGGILCYFSLQQLARPFQASLLFLVFPLISIALENQITGNSISRQSLLLMLPLLSGILLTLWRSPAEHRSRSRNARAERPTALRSQPSLPARWK